MIVIIFIAILIVIDDYFRE